MAITITSWNVQNFTRNDDVYAEKLSLLTDTLQALGSDIIALQEVLDLDALADLAAALGFHYFAATPDGRHNRVAILTREQPVAVEEISLWRTPPGAVVYRFDNDEHIEVEVDLPRPALQLTVPYQDVEVVVICAHLKSKLLTFGGHFSTLDETLRAQSAFFALMRRSAEATTLRERVTELLSADRPLIVMGDFNDVHEAATTQMLYGPSGSQITRPEDTIRANSAFQREDQGDMQRLFNVVNIVPKDQRWTRKHNGEEELLDHILASHHLMPRDDDGLRQVPVVTILNDDVPNLLDHDPSGGAVPDHAPVTAVFV